jgi:hypothetical protein
MFTMVPRPSLRICGTQAWMQKKLPSSVGASVLRQSSSVISISGR